ncbi:futalosine hydrolase [Geomicrobium sp. JCM 19055]|uniref:futalosine hydrolase n=1 Tax=Geomicrobium sp. JCM 19055 TaxID=1460649 RepID=UPI00045ED2C0|nr:futalosine hydrolase [Geomicrobium sp. JCM 19055]GAK01725.1 menaquinone via futalosine step 2 [Geomicrobium sp. JCM 19055]
MRRILIMTAVEAEREAVKAGLRENVNVTVELAGVGPAQAAARTAIQLAKQNYDLVINAGIAGGFREKVQLEDIVVSTIIQAADLGADTGEQFIPVEELGFGSSSIECLRNEVDRFRELENVFTGRIITKSTVTGTDEEAKRLQIRYEDAVAEGMEGFGVATAAEEFGVPVLEVRAISNYIGKRERDKWKIKEALASLKQVMEVVR